MLSIFKGYFFAFSALWAYPGHAFCTVKSAEQQVCVLKTSSV